MRIEVEQVAPGHWCWHLLWEGRMTVDSPESYGSESAARAAAQAWCRDVERAGRGVR